MFSYTELSRKWCWVKVLSPPRNVKRPGDRVSTGRSFLPCKGREYGNIPCLFLVLIFVFKVRGGNFPRQSPKRHSLGKKKKRVHPVVFSNDWGTLSDTPAHLYIHYSTFFGSCRAPAMLATVSCNPLPFPCRSVPRYDATTSSFPADSSILFIIRFLVMVLRTR